MTKKLHFNGLQLPLLDENDTKTFPRMVYIYDNKQYATKIAEASTKNKKHGVGCIKHKGKEWIFKPSWGYALPNSSIKFMQATYSNYATMTQLPDEMLQDGIDSSSATNLQSMFYGCAKLQSIPVFDTSNVTNMNVLFRGCSSLTTIPQINTQSATAMNSFCADDKALTTVPSLNTSNVTDFCAAFENCTSLSNVGYMDTSSAINLSSMFQNCTKLPAVFPWIIDCKSITYANELAHMFLNNSTTVVRLKNVSAAVAKVINTGTMGSKQIVINPETVPEDGTEYQLKTSGIPKKITNLYDTLMYGDWSALKIMDRFFVDCISLQNIKIYQLPTNVTSMKETYSGCTALVNIPPLDTSKVTNMSKCFYNCSKLPTTFTTIDLFSFAKTYSLDCSSINSIDDIKDIFTGSSVTTVTFKNVKEELKPLFTAANLGSQLTTIKFI